MPPKKIWLGMVGFSADVVVVIYFLSTTPTYLVGKSEPEPALSVT